MATRSTAMTAAPAGASFCISRAGSFAAPGKDGFFCTYYPKGQEATILSVNPEGGLETRPKDAAGGAWESWKPSADGNRAVFPECAEVYAFPLVD